MANSDRAFDLLAKVDLFEDLSKKDLRQVAGITKPFEFATGDALTEEGKPAGRFHVIESGTVKVVVKGRIHATRGPGEYIGELSLLDDEPRSATVIALEPVRTLSIPVWNFRALLKTQGAISYKLLVTLSGRLRAALETSYVD